MPVHQRLSARDYYDLNPHASLNAGDIWSGLPTFGLIPGGSSRALVITPACDLTNRKVETASYLPILSLERYFLSPAFLAPVVRETDRLLEAVGLSPLPGLGSRYVPPGDGEITVREQACEQRRASGGDKRVAENVERAMAGLRLLRQCCKPGTAFPRTDFISVFGEKQWSETVQRTVRNANRLDTFFLPHDGQKAEWSAVPEPSVVLFRYPFSAPIQLLECAQDVQLPEWDGVIRDLKPVLPGVVSFDKRPLKHATLRSGFLGDLLTRFASMHVRLGTPDMTDGTIDEIVRGITGVK